MNLPSKTFGLGVFPPLLVPLSHPRRQPKEIANWSPPRLKLAYRTPNVRNEIKKTPNYEIYSVTTCNIFRNAVPQTLEVLMSETVKKAFGDDLTRIRNEADQTQEGISLNCYMSLRYYQYLEKGENNPTMITLFRLANTLECEPETLIKAAWKARKKENRKKSK